MGRTASSEEGTSGLRRFEQMECLALKLGDRRRKAAACGLVGSSKQHLRGWGKRGRLLSLDSLSRLGPHRPSCYNIRSE